MTNEQLALCIKNGENEAENSMKLYRQNLGAIQKLANKFHGLEDSEDLKQEAYIGLIRAVELWEPKQNSSFITYAFFWIKQSMLRYVYQNSGLVRIPIHQKTKIHQYNKAVTSIQSRFGRNPSKHEIMAMLEITSEQYEQLRKDALAIRVRSTSEPVGEDEESSLEDFIPDESDQMEDVIEKIQKEELAKELWDQVDRLPESEASVIRTRYCNDLTLKQCGDALGMSSEHVRQLHDRAIRTLRKPSVAKRLRPYLTDSTSYTIGLRSGYTSFIVSGASAQESAMIFLEDHTGPIWKESF